MNVIIAILGVISAVLLLYGLYFGVFAVIGLPLKAVEFPETEERKHFAVLIPARNEEAVIGDLVDSLKAMDYPKDRYEIYVIVNHCTDKTEEAARAHGARILDCREDTKSKGEVLDYAFRTLKDHQEIDAYVVFDADNVVDPAFLTEMNKAIMTAPAAQSFRIGKNAEASWVADCYEVYYASQDTFYNHPKTRIGRSASINGTGWAIRKEVIEQGSFVAKTITEDFEFTIQCALQDIPIAYCSKAITKDEYCEDLKTSMRQRFRWTFGFVQNLRIYEGKLFKKAFKGSAVCLDTAMVNLLLPSITLTIVAVLLGYAGACGFMSLPVYILVQIAALWFGLSFSAFIAIAKTHRGVRRHWKGILANPLFIITWVPIMISCFFRRSLHWKPIEHGKSKQ